MKMKTLFAVMAVSMGSTVATAESYQGEVGLGYTDIGNADAITLFGEYHFNTVNTNGHPLAEAAFLEKSNNVKAMYTDGDNFDAQDISLEFYVGDMFYVAPGYANIDAGIADADAFYVALGFTPIDGMLITTVVPEDNYELNLSMKYVTELAGGTFLNFEAGYADGGDFLEDTTTVTADYYFDDTFSVGASIINADDTDFGLNATKFFTGNFSGSVSYINSDIDDTWAIGVSFRFR